MTAAASAANAWAMRSVCPTAIAGCVRPTAPIVSVEMMGATPPAAAATTGRSVIHRVPVKCAPRTVRDASVAPIRCVALTAARASLPRVVTTRAFVRPVRPIALAWNAAVMVVGAPVGIVTLVPASGENVTKVRRRAGPVICPITTPRTAATVSAVPWTPIVSTLTKLFMVAKRAKPVTAPATVCPVRLIATVARVDRMVAAVTVVNAAMGSAAPMRGSASAFLTAWAKTVVQTVAALNAAPAAKGCVPKRASAASPNAATGNVAVTVVAAVVVPVGKIRSAATTANASLRWVAPVI